MTTYRPSATVRLTLRCEEFEQVDQLRGLLPAPDFESVLPDPFADLPPSPTSSEDGGREGALERNQEQLAQLQRDRANLSPEVYNQRRAELFLERDEIMNDAMAVGDDEMGVPPPAVAATPPDDLTVIGNIQPRSVLIERNGLAQAGTATIDLSWVDAPIDPRILRSAHVVIALGVVSPESFEAGVERGETRDDGSLLSTYSPQLTGDGRAGSFSGYVDRWSVHYSDSGDTIQLQCRDMSAPVRDLQLGSSETIDLDRPIDLGVREFLDRMSPTTRGIEVRYEGPGDPPAPSANGSSRRRTRRGSTARRGRTGGERMSAWDHITDVVRGLGLMPIMDGFVLRLVEPRTLYRTEGVRRMVYGRDLKSLDFERTLQGVKVPTIEVRSYDPDRGRTLWGRYPVASVQRSSGVVGVDEPPRPSRANVVPPAGADPDEGIQTFLVSGVTDPARLVTIAENVFQQIGRHEIRGRMETADAWSYDMEPEEADLLQLTAGESVEVLLAQGDETDAQVEAAGTATTLARIQAMARARRTDYLVGLGWDRVVAERFSALQDATGFQTVFRVSTVTLRYSRDQGIGVDIDFINYVEVREDEAAS